MAEKTHNLENTPTWAFAGVCFLFIYLSLFLEFCINFISKWSNKRQNKAMSTAIEKLKEELMVLGFISILLGVTQNTISRICVPIRLENTMLPCHLHQQSSLSSDGVPSHCAAKGKVSMVSENGLHQLHIFIFILAVVHVMCAVATMALGRAKMRKWKAWEKETQTVQYQVANDSKRFRFIRETSFARRHLNIGTTSPLHIWTMCFFRQFYNSITKVDYFTLRHGFIAAHFSKYKTFNFQKYIKYSLEDDFKVVFRIRPSMWFLVVVFMLIDIHGWYSYFWLSFIPLALVLTIGTKLQIIVAKMAIRLHEQNRVITGALVVQPNDDHFWFSNPKLILFLLHLVLFQNSFELSFFIWIWWEFGLRSCYHENFEITIARVVIAVIVQFVCAYSTLPMYALVTQMGSKFKGHMFEESVGKIIRKWHEDVRTKKKEQQAESVTNVSPTQ
ncbi:mlo protein [Dioscorea alata]|uniref:Mlo protein n=1 Tax=Dioscorea alata TaxID=55571 RepID=A0ACB7U967_DIOAL|nr:mlo protein [Dioscorea alata]